MYRPFNVPCVLSLAWVLISTCPSVSQAQHDFPLSIQSLKYGGKANYPRINSVTKFEQQPENAPAPEMVLKTYTVEVPYTEFETQTYTVDVPSTVVVTAEDGSKTSVQKIHKEERTRQVAVQRIRKEQRSRMVPAKIETVEVKNYDFDLVEGRFPRKDAKFNYVSGDAISDTDLKTIASSEIPVLVLPAGQQLTKFQRSILNPKLVVMTLKESERKHSKPHSSTRKSTKGK